ncbi:MAG: hypothetical protein LW834_19010 [Cyanobium sp. 49614_E6]|nr:hypothetical protein [Cyanobium sp. 49614_E6]
MSAKAAASLRIGMESINLRSDELAAINDELARLLASWQNCGGLKPDR